MLEKYFEALISHFEDHYYMHGEYVETLVAVSPLRYYFSIVINSAAMYNYLEFWRNPHRLIVFFRIDYFVLIPFFLNHSQINLQEFLVFLTLFTPERHKSIIFHFYPPELIYFTPIQTNIFAIFITCNSRYICLKSWSYKNSLYSKPL